jgi:hypothetical protein
VRLRDSLRSLIKAIQGNFDHLQGTVRELGEAHNATVDDVEDIVTYISSGSAMGPEGPEGPPGPIGFPGDEGDPGFFIPGRDGTPGTPGAAGADGVLGRDGTPGMPGDDGEQGFFVPGPAGPTGPEGPAGPAGADGGGGGTPVPPAIYLPEAEDGLTIVGPKGATGATGATGPPGADGGGGGGGGAGVPYFPLPDDDPWGMPVPPSRGIPRTIVHSTIDDISGSPLSTKFIAPWNGVVGKFLCSIVTAPTSTMTIKLLKNAVVVSTVTITTGNTVSSTDEADVGFVAGDALTIEVTTPADGVGPVVAYIVLKGQ